MKKERKHKTQSAKTYIKVNSTLLFLNSFCNSCFITPELAPDVL